MKSIRPDSEPMVDAGEHPRLNLGENLPGRTPPNRSFLVLAAIGATILMVAAIYVFMRGRAAVLRPDAAPKYDAPYYVYGPEGSVPAPAEASVDDAAVEPPIDTVAAPADVKVVPPIDAKVAAPIDAKVAAPIDAKVAAIDAVVAGTAKLKIGANPWGDIFIDGEARGRTPKLIDVSAGKHVVDLVFSGEDKPVKKTFNITVAPNETLPIDADFTK